MAKRKKQLKKEASIKNKNNMKMKKKVEKGMSTRSGNLKSVTNTAKSASQFHKKQLKNLPLKDRLREQLRASRFRYFNEQFYVSSSNEAKRYFSENPSEFEAYHIGYEQQASLWPVNPVDEIIKELQRRPKSNRPETVADFGCGKAKIAQTLQGKNFKIFSFDLVAVNEFVTACDMSATHLFNSSIDIAIFCLSLMGSNISQFIREANRVLKDGGLLKICEVKSRFDKVEEFIRDIDKFGFSLLKKDLTDPAFYYFDFKKKISISKSRKKKLPEIVLKPCLYKHR